ncbi:type II toxin-antitoxin system HicB family antitoxin [Candidatus Woesearchaeota archaeon]|nr:type II toxin-antitoxin system HicB family antitoxin [Candidatus Woesearchaeota archaeon]
MGRNIHNFTVLIEQDEDGWYVAKVPDLRGCATQGKTVEQALERVKEAIKVCVEAEKEVPQQLKFVKVENIAVAV